MPAFELFTDWYNEGSGPSYLSKPGDILNDASLRNYELLSRCLDGDGKMELLGGNEIRSTIFLNDPGTAETFFPGDTVDIVNVQSLTHINAPWRQIRGYATWTDVEINDTTVGLDSNAEGLYHKFADIKKHKEQAACTSLFNLMERKLATAASAANTDNGKDAYPVFYSITTDGLAPGGFTNVHGKNPTTESNWRNQSVTWTIGQPFDSQNGIIAGMDQMKLLVRFKRPPRKDDYFDQSSLRNQIIATNREGHYTMQQAARAANDYLRKGPGDPAYDPMYDNRPIIPVEAFDDQSSFTAAQPGYLFIDMNYWKMVCHKSHSGKPSKVFDFGEKPDTKVVYYPWRYNIINCSRRRNGYLYAA